MTELLTVEAAEALVTDTLARCRTGERQAAAVARALVGAELVGQSGHGLHRLPAYAAQAAVGKVDGHAVPEMTEHRPGCLAIDAAHGFAYPALELALAELPTRARANGIAAAGIGRSHHAGVTGLSVEALAEVGFVALLFANAPATMAAAGGSRPRLGTDPIAIAAPMTGAGDGAAPIVVDLALSQVARGKVIAAAQAGKEIPETWALDSAGRPTTDPEAALAGTMQPLGGAKGAALALMVEVLAAGLTGSRFAPEASAFTDAEGSPPGTGQLIVAIDPEAFGADGAGRIAALAGLLEDEPGVRLPGRRRQALRAERRATGIPVAPGLLETIAAVGR